MLLLHILECLVIASLALASPTKVKRDRDDDTPTPSLPFTLAAFQSPGSNPISGVRVRASGGTFWVNSQNQKPDTGCGNSGHHNSCPPGNETVLFVDKYGRAWLDSQDPQQVYMNAQTGVLSYLSSKSTPANTFAPGAITTGFRHLGQGTAVSQSIPNVDPQYQNPGPSQFFWIDPENSYWMLCPRPGSGYQVMMMVGGTENWGACLGGVNMVALDYSGASPAAGEYL